MIADGAVMLGVLLSLPRHAWDVSARPRNEPRRRGLRR